MHGKPQPQPDFLTVINLIAFVPADHRLASIEVRLPMLDEEMVGAALRLPHRLKTDGQRGKLVLRGLCRLVLL